MKTHQAPARRSCHFVALVPLVLGLAQAQAPAQPANDLFANRLLLVGTTVTQTGSTVGATREPGEPLHAGTTGGRSVWFSWTAPADGMVSVATTGSSFDTVLAVYTGTTLTSLSVVAANDDEEPGALLTSRVSFQARQNATYQIAVDGYSGDSGNYVLRIAPAPAAPTAPAWRLPDVNGQMIDSTSFAGKVVIVDFWGVWCPYCVAEIPDFIALQAKYRADGLAIVGLDWGDTTATARSFIASEGINYQIVMTDQATQTAFGGIEGYPTTFVLDRHNRIANKFVGEQDRATFEQVVIPLLYSDTRLAARAAGNQLVFAWPNYAVKFNLESAATLQNPLWTTWATSPSLVNGSNCVTLIPTENARFFRLHLAQ